VSETAVQPAAAPTVPTPMLFAVDGWDPGYGSSLDQVADLGESTARVDAEVERPVKEWAPIPPRPQEPPEVILFVDGVRRIDARIWISDPDSAHTHEASVAVCASYAAGVVCCCPGAAHVADLQLRRGLFATAAHAVEIRTPLAAWQPVHTVADPSQGDYRTLVNTLQRRLTELEILTAANARAQLAGHHETDDDLLVIDGPLRGRTQIPRTVGLIKSHHASYLPPELTPQIGSLPPASRTPVFLMGTSWDRYSWYLRLPCRPGSPWAGIVRVECSPDLPLAEAVALADRSQVVLPRFASEEYKDSRAPQNLYPIAGLENQLRHRLGDARLLHRSLQRQARIPVRSAGQ